MNSYLRRLVYGAALCCAGLIPPGQATAQDLDPAALAARSYVAPAMSGITEWAGPETSPKPIAGKRIAVISCCQAAEGAARPARAIVEAGSVIGWDVDVVDGKGDPQEQNRALNAAVDAKYDGIILVFVDTPTVAEGVQRTIEAGIPLLTLGSMKNTPETVPDISHDYTEEGRLIAQYMIWKSNGQVDALLLKNTDLYAVTEGQFKGTNEVLSNPDLCPDCKLDIKEWTLSNLDTQVAAITSAAVQSNPSLNWVWCFDACMSRAVRTLMAAGLQEGISGAGFNCNGENLQFIAQGQVQAVSNCDPRDWEAYAAVDNINRMMQGQPAVDHGIPMLLIDNSNIGILTPEELTKGWQGGYDFRAKYRELWGVVG